VENAIIPNTYEEWRHCIVVECGLALTPQFIAARIHALQDSQDFYTQKFTSLYGKAYLEQVITWFQQAEKTA